MTHRERKGFTLVELLIAVVLFATAMLIGGRSILEFVRQVSVSEVRELAAEFAMEELERVKLLPYEQINSVPATPVPEAPEYIRTVAVAVFGTDPAGDWDTKIQIQNVGTSSAVVTATFYGPFEGDGEITALGTEVRTLVIDGVWTLHSVLKTQPWSTAESAIISTDSTDMIAVTVDR